MKRTGGRPRQYDPKVALNRAISVFANKGFAGASLDELSEAMEMKRPSLYLAFGDKEALYRGALAHFVQQMRESMNTLVVAEPDLRKALKNFYSASLDVYFAESPAHGCFLFCTAPVEAIAHPEIQSDMKDILREVDQLLAGKFREAQASGQYPPEGNAVEAGRMTQAILHSLAIRARAGETRTALNRMAAHAVRVICD